MPKTVLDQEGKFNQDEIFKRLKQDNKVRYTGSKTGEDSITNFMQDLKLGKLNIAFIDSGINLRLHVDSGGQDSNDPLNNENITFENDERVYIQSHLILNGVCVKCLGHINLKDLCGIARIEFDKKNAQEESISYRNQLNDYNHHFGIQEDNITLEKVLEDNNSDIVHVTDHF